MLATSARRANERNLGESFTRKSSGKPAQSEISRRRRARSSRFTSEGFSSAKPIRQAFFESRYSSAMDTRRIMRSYDSRASAPKENTPCDSSTMPRVFLPACFGNSRAQYAARSKPAMMYGMTTALSP